MKILAVDDNKESLYMLEIYLKGSGHEVVSAGDGVEAFEKLKENSVDIIISDIMMPNMDGFQLCRKCKQDEKINKIPFIFYSAIYTDKKDEEFALSLGAEKFLVKPIDPEKLMGFLEDTMKEQKKGGLAVPGRPIKDESIYLTEYNRRLVEKLEKKVNELEREITGHKKAEKALHESEERYIRITEAITDYIYTVCVESGQPVETKHREACLAVTGYKKEEFAADPYLWIRMVVEEDSDLVRRQAYDVLSGKIPRPIEHRIIRKDGNIEWVESSVVPHYDIDGKLVSYDGIVRDITERKQAEEFIKNILESVEEGFVVLDRNYRILSANKAFCEQTGVPVEEITGKHCYKVTHNMDRPCYEWGLDCVVKKTFETGESHHAVHTMHNKGIDVVYTEVKSYPMKDESGKFDTVIETANNITEQRKLEAQFRQAQKMETVGQLAGGVAHDFNNILTAMIGYGHIMRMRMEENSPLKVQLDQILLLTEKAAQLTQSLLAFSRKQIINPGTVDLNEFLSNEEKLLKRLLSEDIQLKVLPAQGELKAIADIGQISQVLMNLVTNARDAMPEGGTLTIKAEESEIDSAFIHMHGFGMPGKYAVLSVTDTGAGMDEKTQARIFEPFFTTKETGKGTGLGLSTAYGIMKQHNGYINVYSESGKGTTFKIYLPLTRIKVKDKKPAVAADISGGKETLLYAEDDAEVRKSTKEMLEEFGYKIIEAVDGEDAIEKFMKNKDKIQLVILDVIMPKKNGKETYNEIKKINPDIKALFMSGYAEDIIHKKMVLEKGLNFLSKPFTPDNILRTLRKELDK